MKTISPKWKEVSRRKDEFMQNIAEAADSLPDTARSIANASPEAVQIFIREKRAAFQVVIYAPSLGFGVGFQATEIRPDRSRPTLSAYYRRYSRSVVVDDVYSRALEAIQHVENRDRLARRGRRAASRARAA